MITFFEQNAAIILIVIGSLFVLELAAKLLLDVWKSRSSGHRHEQRDELFAREISVNGEDVQIMLDVGTHLPVYVSENVERLTGLSTERIYADVHCLSTLLRKEDMRKLNSELSNWNGKEAFIRQMAYAPKQEPSGWCEVRLRNTEDGKYCLLTIQDRRKEQQEKQELLQKLEDAQRVDESKTIFLSKMSHEIRTPMNGMLGMIALAKLSAAGNKLNEVSDYLDRAESLSKFLLSIINDILDMTRIESGKLELEKAPFSLRDMIEKIRAMFETTIEDKGIRFQLDVVGFTHYFVMGDELRITQIITNFLSNASKFTPSGGTISLLLRQMELRDGEMSLMIRVKDTGKGMTSAFLHRIFKPFEQEDSGIARRFGGSGLGMSIADSLVQLMGGQILVDSEEGKGSEFTVFITLPVAEEIVQKKEENASEEIDLNGRRLMMAEDNAVNAIVATRLLQKRGLVIETAVNGKEAVELFAAKEPGYYDAILMDIHMPEMDGWEATKCIRGMKRQDGKTIPIFALSADAFVEDRRHSIEVGMNGHIAKPIDYEELEQALKSSLR